MNKIQLKLELLASCDRDIEAALAAARTAHESASHEDNQPENKYDTLALEAAYLAHGQSERILQLQQEKIRLGRWEPLAFDDSSPIALGALVTLEYEDEQRLVWITPGGGRQLMQDGQLVQLVSAATPLALALIGKELDDEVVMAGKSWLITAIV
ncbi:GreA/GreB family elongation factor [Oceanobacter mangrovi]|uniref:GreA/GreB family elongation factor n=1 Tax=Oceanobacter mangrovi TaxID=2862510 RepID=UPI001C8DE63E|nr:GreA/GreB family elongation factor [Oceanobacter mangrovi]